MGQRLYLLYGEDQFSLSQDVEKIKTVNLPPGAEDFNYTRIDASRSGFNLEEVFEISNAFPFLSEKRLVVVKELFTRLGKSGDSEKPAPRQSSKGNAKTRTLAVATPRERFIVFLEKIPDTTVLVLCENKVAKNDLVFKAIQKYGQVQEFIPPKGLHLEKWIMARSYFHKIKLEPQAASLLAQFFGSDLWRIENELQKLIAYAGEGHPITSDMVEKVSVEVRDTPIFKLTEAVSRKELADALLQLNRIRSESTLARAGLARYVFNGIIRQIYDLLRVREMALSQRNSNEIASALGMHPFVAEKNLNLSRKFSAGRLDFLYHRLTELDYADKTGHADLSSELDLLLVEICAKS